MSSHLTPPRPDCSPLLDECRLCAPSETLEYPVECAGDNDGAMVMKWSCPDPTPPDISTQLLSTCPLSAYSLPSHETGSMGWFIFVQIMFLFLGIIGLGLVRKESGKFLTEFERRGRGGKWGGDGNGGGTEMAKVKNSNKKSKRRERGTEEEEIIFLKNGEMGGV